MQEQIVSFYAWRTPIQQEAATDSPAQRYGAQPYEKDTCRNSEVEGHDLKILTDALDYLRLTLDARPPVHEDAKLEVNCHNSSVLAPVLTYLNNVAVREILSGKRAQRDSCAHRRDTPAYARYHAAAGALQMRDLLIQGLDVFYQSLFNNMLILEGNMYVTTFANIRVVFHMATGLWKTSFLKTLVSRCERLHTRRF